MRYFVCLPSSSSSVTQAPKNTRFAIRGRLVDHGHAVEPFAQEAHAPVDLAQALLAVGVFGILGAIALRRGFGDRLRDPRPLHLPQLVQLLFEACCACGGDELRSGFLCGSVAAHDL